VEAEPSCARPVQFDDLRCRVRNHWRRSSRLRLPNRQRRVESEHKRMLRRAILPTLMAEELDWMLPWIPDPFLNGTLVPRKIEKNWISFEDQTENFYIQNLWPYTILQEDDVPSSSALLLNGITNRLSQSVVSIFDRSVTHQVSLHGGANCILINPPNPSSTIPYLNRPPYYLGAFHTVSTGPLGIYWNYLNYLFEFDTIPPYTVLRVSDPIPLLTAPPSDLSTSFPLAFLSGLTMVNDRLLISYGSSNVESRVLSLSRQGLELLFSEPVPKFF